MEPVYLDYNATTPLDESVIKVIETSCRNFWGNPSSSYESGRKAKKVVDQARQQIGLMVGATFPEKEITFTSGGTEANHLAMHSAIIEFRKWSAATGSVTSSLPHVVTTNIEHCATELPLKHWQEQGRIDVTFVQVENGQVDPAKILEAVQPNTCLVTCIMANNETGVIQPISALGEEISNLNEFRKSSGLFSILLHTDAAQTVGKNLVRVNDIRVDYLTIVGHKFYGPRIGALYHRDNVAPLHPLFIGGGQEKGLRAGTENTPMIAGLGQASTLVFQSIESDQKHLKEMRDLLETKLKAALGDDKVHVNFWDRDRLPNTASLSFSGKLGHELLRSCSGGLEASTAAACHSGSEVSSILVRSGLDPIQARGTIRLSVGRSTTKEQIQKAVKQLQDAYNDQLSCQK